MGLLLGLKLGLGYIKELVVVDVVIAGLAVCSSVVNGASSWLLLSLLLLLFWGLWWWCWCWCWC